MSKRKKWYYNVKGKSMLPIGSGPSNGYDGDSTQNGDKSQGGGNSGSGGNGNGSGSGTTSNNSVAPIPKLTTSVQNGIAPLSVVFSFVVPNDCRSIIWDFGDGSNSQTNLPGGSGITVSVSHTFSNAGSYLVKATCLANNDNSLGLFNTIIDVTQQTPDPNSTSLFAGFNQEAILIIFIVGAYLLLKGSR